MKTVTCAQCQTDNPADALVCEECGASLASQGAVEDKNFELAKPETNETEELLDWLKDLEPAGEQPDPGSSKSMDMPEGDVESGSLTDWLAEISPENEDWGEVEDRQVITDWFDGTEDIYEEQEVDPSKLAQTAPLTDYHEVEGIPEQLASKSLPDWLKQEQPTGESSFEEDEPMPEPPELSGEIEDKPGEYRQVESDEEYPVEASPSEPEERATLDEDSELIAEPTAETAEEPADWYAELASTDVEGALDELLDDHGELQDEIASDEWMDLVDEIPEPEEEPEAKPSFLEETTDLSESEIPDWLESLKPEELVDPAAVDQPAEESGPLMGLKGVIPIVSVSADPVETTSTPDYTMSKGQQQQVALLKQLTKAEPVMVPTESRQAIGDDFFPFRLVIGSLLLFLVIAGWFLPSIREILPGWETQPAPVYTEAAYAELDNVSGAPVLVAFEYTPAVAGELDPVATSFLERLAANGSTVFTISQVEAGVPVAGRVVEQVEGLDSQELGFLPGDAIGLRNFAGCLNNTGTCANVTGLSLEEETQSLLSQTSLIVIMSGERDAIVNWIEQVGAQVDVPMISGITQAMDPIAAPYVASRQLVGVVSGLPAVAAIDDNVDVDGNLVGRAMNSVTLVQWLAVIVLVIGALFYGLAGLVPAGVKKQI
ncbi:MAG: hypothetical protein PVH03_11495 [Chloroflexota bacterium]|jgi:hypothetical protein